MSVAKFIANLKFAVKINSAFIGIMVAVTFLTALSVWSMYGSMVKGRETRVKERAQIAALLVEKYIKLEKSGAMSRIDAQTQAINDIANLRTDEINYFWIIDGNSKIILEPSQTALNGKDGANIKDKNGKKYYSDMAAIAKQGGGQLRFNATKSNGENFEKLSYLQPIKEWNWAIGTGVDLGELYKELAIIVGKLTLVFLAVMPLVVMYLFFVIGDVVKNTHLISKKVTEIANGGNAANLPTERKDEMGEIARNLADMAQKLEHGRSMENQNTENARREIENKRILEQKIANFEREIAQILVSVNGATDEMAASTDNMANVVGEVSGRASNVARASTETSHSVQTVAAATEELSASVQEISQQTGFFTHAIDSVIKDIARADETSIMLDSAAERIGQIVEIIQTIAGQINLLALNATIESARAGEAGKGFAVVASEVKNLANQTGNATHEITENVANIKHVAEQVIAALNGIKSSITSVESISASISAAVEEQTAVTRDIAHNMSIASNGTGEIDSSINEVSEFSNSATNAAEQTKGSAHLVAFQAKELSNKISAFLSSVRAA